MQYRAAVDGLRAVAVIPVILFHADFAGFEGGFVGVDVFFVISGFLITSIILSDLERGTFSLVNFYERRARRILPALFLVMLVSLPLSWVLLMPDDLTGFSHSLMAVSSFSSNILFWQQSGYWDAANDLKPLLHTWSLAVEEQYYLLFPLFLMLIWRYRPRWIGGAFLVVAAVSLAMAQWGAHHKPVAAFYLLPTRAWELAIGAGLAYHTLHREALFGPAPARRWIPEVLGVVGLLMIGYAVVAFDENMPFPGLRALVPTVGTGLVVLVSSTDTLVTRLLAVRPLVTIGLISYSAYLWHQPLLAFARHATLTEPSDATLISLAALSLPLAYLSWRFVEHPFRKKGVFGRRTVFALSAVGLVGFAGLGFAGHLAEGFGGRSARNSEVTAASIVERLRPNSGLSRACDGVFTLAPECRTSDQPEIVVWGDSYAMQLVQGILASNPDAGLIQFTKSVCGPFFDVAPVVEPRYPVSWARGCLEFTSDVRDWLRANPSVEYVVVSSPFAQYLEAEHRLLFRSGEVTPAGATPAEREFEKTLAELRSLGVTPVVFVPPPTNGNDIGRCLAKAEWLGLDHRRCDFDTADFPRPAVDVYRFLAGIDGGHSVVRLPEMICGLTRCASYRDSTFLYRDVGHLSQEGVRFLGREHDFYAMITGQERPR